MSDTTTCRRCKRTFSTPQGLGLHFAHQSKAPKMRRERLCPDRRTPEEAREQDARLVRVRVRLRDPEMATRVLSYLAAKERP